MHARGRFLATNGAARPVLFGLSAPMFDTVDPDGERASATNVLTPAERQAVELATRGFSNQHVAELRGTSLHTTANQLHAAYRKLGVASRRELRAVLGVGRAAPRRSGCSLSPREVEVLSLVEQGQANKVIAATLGVAISTVSTTVTRARRKLGRIGTNP